MMSARAVTGAINPGWTPDYWSETFTGGPGELSLSCSRNARVSRVLDGCVSNFICGVHTTQLYTSTASS